MGKGFDDPPELIDQWALSWAARFKPWIIVQCVRGRVTLFHYRDPLPPGQAGDWLLSSTRVHR
jgi:hypothetical protein